MNRMDNSPNIAIVSDWLTGFAGGERVLEQILACFPEADMFAVCDFLREDERAWLQGRRVQTSFIQRLPFAKRYYRHYLPLMPIAIEQLDLSGYDLVISSSHAVAKGVLTGPSQLHVSYVHSPIRYAWELQHAYLRESGLNRGFKGVLARCMLHRIRQWDTRTANGVDVFMANSQFIADRIWKTYRRGAHILHPPVEVDEIPWQKDKADFFVTASRFVPYKRIPLIVEAFAGMPDRQLVVIGDGPDARRVHAAARDYDNITIMGHLPRNALLDWLSYAKAFVFAAEEDFGIAPVEALAAGTPVIAYGRGGVRESVTGSQTGIFFDEQSVTGIREAVGRFDATCGWDAAAIREHSVGFSSSSFRSSIWSFVETRWQEFSEGVRQFDPAMPVSEATKRDMLESGV